MIDPQQPDYTSEGAAITDLILALFRANGRLLRAGDKITHDLGLTAARWQVLGAIVETPRTVAQIARHFESTRQGVLWVVAALARDGVVELIDNPDHKRAKLVRVTERGHEICRKIKVRQQEWVNGFGVHFDCDEVRAATSVIEHLGREVID